MIQFRQNPAPMPGAMSGHLAAASAKSCRQRIVERLADAICELAGASEPVTHDALQAHGFPAAVVDHYAEEARTLARRRFVRRA